MRRLYCYLLCLAPFLNGYNAAGRSEVPLVTILNLSVQPVMPADVGTWPGLPAGLSIDASAGTASGTGSLKIVLQIRQGSATVCGNPAETGVLVGAFRTRTFTAADLQSALMKCPRLSPGGYSLCARFYNEANEPVSAEACRPFEVESPAPIPPPEHYTSPENVTPAVNTRYVAKELQSPVRFSWTSVSPQPAGGIMYRLQIWAVGENQTLTQAIAGSQPIYTKDVRDALEVSVSDALPVPCKAPYICRYAWNVEALSAVGASLGEARSYSTATEVLVTNYVIQIDSIKVWCTGTPGIYAFSYTVTNVNAGTAKLTNLVATSSAPAGATIASFSPPLTTTIPSGAQINISGTINAAANLSAICIGAEITDVANSFWKASRDTCTSVMPCKCDFCESPKTKIIIPAGSVVLNANNTLALTQPIAISTSPVKLIKSIRAELMYYEYLPESEDCLPCNKDSKTYGNLSSGTLAGVTGAGADTHALQWNFSPYKNFSVGYNAAMTITMPPSIKCCGATVRWCIRYVITFNDCTVCSKVVCYEYKKSGCGNGNPNPNPNPNN